MTDAVERKIREAMDRGEFDDLPGAGLPLDGVHGPYDPNWWVKAWVERERDAGRRAEDLVAIERMAGRLWAAPTGELLEAVMDEIDEQRRAASLEPLPRDEVRRMWRSIQRHRP